MLNAHWLPKPTDPAASQELLLVDEDGCLRHRVISYDPDRERAAREIMAAAYRGDLDVAGASGPRLVD